MTIEEIRQAVRKNKILFFNGREIKKVFLETLQYLDGVNYINIEYKAIGFKNEINFVAIDIKKIYEKV